jgi:hydroxymethylbilane synthase
VRALRLRIGTRGSALALWQARHVQERLASLGHEATLQEITTTGDRIQDRRLEVVGGKGAFLKEIEEALLAGEVDLAVHSLKDVPTALPAGLSLVAILERADPRDVLVSGGARLSELRAGARVGTTSLRRRSLVRALRPELELEDLRGNVDTRLRRLREGRFDAILLAMAGLARLGRASEATEALDPREFVPAPGQGAIAIECRDDDVAIRSALTALDHAATARAVAAERAFLAALGGGCNVPLGAHAFAAGGDLELVAFVASPDGSAMLRGERRGSDAAALGRALAEDLVARGARALMATASPEAG